ncbi:hypothetical protein Hanom_Chr00s000002g01599881 [Helianthus anomalus]
MEKDRVLSHEKVVQEELERKAVSKAQKVRSELSAEMEKFRIDTDFVSQVQERYQSLTVELEASNAKAQAKQVELEEREEQLRKLQQVCDSLISKKNQVVQSSTAPHARLKEAESSLDQYNAEVDSLTSHLAGLQGDKNWLITNGLVGAFEYLRQLESFVTLLDRLSTSACKSGHHDGVYEGYFNCQQMGRITPEFQESGGKLTTEMADALEAVYNDPLPAYAELVDKVAEDGVDSLRHMLEVADESVSEKMDRKCNRKISDMLHTLDVAKALVRLQDPVKDKTMRGKKANSGDTMPCINRSCKGIGEDDPSRVQVKADIDVVVLTADTLRQAFPPEYIQRCRVVYQRCRCGCRCVSSIEDQKIPASPVDEVNVDDLIADPHPLEYYGKALHTPAEVLAMFPDV